MSREEMSFRTAVTTLASTHLDEAIANGVTDLIEIIDNFRTGTLNAIRRNPKYINLKSSKIKEKIRLLKLFEKDLQTKTLDVYRALSFAEDPQCGETLLMTVNSVYMMFLEAREYLTDLYLIYRLKLTPFLKLTDDSAIRKHFLKLHKKAIGDKVDLLVRQEIVSSFMGKFTLN